MLGKRIWICAAVLLLVAAIGSAAALTNNEKLGKEIFYDKKLSINKNQACAACHAPAVGFTGPDSIINVMGSVLKDPWLAGSGIASRLLPHMLEIVQI